MHLNIRWRLTLWYGGVLAVVLAIFSAAVYFTLRHQLLARIDRGLAEELADVLGEISRASDGNTLRKWLDRRFASHEGFDFQITRPSGERFFVNPRFAHKFLPLPDMGLSGDTPRYDTASLEALGQWRVIAVAVDGPDGPLTVQVARSLTPFHQESRELLAAFLLTGPLTLLIAVAGGYVMARRALAPVHQMTQAANQITAERLNQRIDVANPTDELGALARTLNDMIARLERSFTQTQRFTADAAHELRTPLAVLRNEAEVALRSPRTADDYRRVLENILEEINRLSAMADQLLFLCRQDAGLHAVECRPVPIAPLLKEVVGNMQLVAEAREIRLLLEEHIDAAVMADASQLRRVLYNLIDNAIKYNEPGGKVTVICEASNASVRVSVQDTGMGIPPEELPLIFDRFYRSDAARARGDSGAGLGLALCQSIMRAHGGTIRAASVLGRGTTVTIVLPVLSDATILIAAEEGDRQPNRQARLLRPGRAQVSS